MSNVVTESENQEEIDKTEWEIRENLESAQEKRLEELLAFCEEFINSEEYERHLQTRNEIVKEDKSVEVSGVDAATQYDENDFIKKIMRKRKKKIAFVEKFLKVWKEKEMICKEEGAKAIEDIIRGQDEGISVVRRKIAEEHDRYLCHREERLEIAERKRLRAMQDLILYGIDSKYFNTNSKIIDRVLTMKKLRHRNMFEKKKREVAIVRKILEEEKRKLQIEREQNKSYTEKVKRKVKIVHDMEVVGVKMELKPKVLKVDVAVGSDEPIDYENHDEEEDETGKTLKKKGKGGKKAKGKGKGKKGKKKGKKSSKKSSGKKKKSDSKKKGKKSKKEIIEDIFELPYMPIVNKRKRIEPKFYENMIEIIEPVEHLQWIYKQKKILAETLDEKNLFPIDVNFTWRPKEIIFQDYKIKTSYKRKLFIMNTAHGRRKFRFHKIFLSTDEEDSLLFEVEKIGCISLCPGLPQQIFLQFHPKEEKGIIQGEILFLSRDLHGGPIKQFLVPFKCYPPCTDINVQPERISFDPIPIWKFEKPDFKYRHWKNVTVTNRGKKPCKVIITRVKDAFEIQEELYQERESEDLGSDKKAVTLATEPNLEYEELLKENKEIVQYISEGFRSCYEEENGEVEENLKAKFSCGYFNKFCFDETYFDLRGNSSKILRVHFNKIDYVGNYVENYVLNVYDTTQDSYNCIGTREISILAETTGLFILVDPESLDFNVCVFNSVYQRSFEIRNLTKLPKRVVVKLPVALSGYLKCKNHEILLQPFSSFPVVLKFMPREDMVTEIKHFNAQTNILDFNLKIEVLDNKFKDVPPTILNSYAILTEANGLILYPVNMEHTRDFHETFILNIGECSTKESVYADIKLINQSYTIQHYAFLNLPDVSLLEVLLPSCYKFQGEKSQMQNKI